MGSSAVQLAGNRAAASAEKGSRPTRVLAVTNMYPTANRPADGVFISEQVRGLRQIGVEVQVHLVDRITQGMSAYYTMLAPVRDIIRSFAPDLLHVMYGGVMADQLLRKITNLPRLVTFHGSDLLGENLSGLARKWISHYGILCSRRAARRAEGVVVVSERLKKALPRLDPGKVRVIPCGIDVQRFLPMDSTECKRRLGWNSSSFHVLFPSRQNNTVKRPELARAAVEKLAAIGAKTELHFLEGIPNETVPVWMNASDVLILTSAHEGSPTAVKEALACGLPVVSVDVGDVAERLLGVEGCHLAEANPSDLASKLLLVQRRGARVMADHRIQQLSLDRVAREVAEYYQEVLLNSNHSHS